MALTQINPALFAGSSNTTAVIQSNGTTAITVDSSQNVGIGTTSPLRKFHVKGSGNTSQFESTSSSGYVYIGDSTSSSIDNQGIGSVGNNLSVLVGGSERMRIDSVGRMTLPYQTMFTARNSYSYNIAAGTSQLVSLNDYFVNVGSCYNNSNFRFTAPVAGQYQLTVTGMLNTGQTSTGNGSIRLRKNGTEFTYTHMNGVHPASACLTLIVSASANDYFEFYADNCYIQGASSYITLFSGQLVG